MGIRLRPEAVNLPSSELAGAPAVHGEGFGERLARHVAARRSQLVLGLDPDPGRLWPRALELVKGGDPEPGPARQAAEAVTVHCALVIDAVAEQCVAVKLQVACFER